MGDHEVEFHAKLALPEWGGLAAQIETRYAGKWSKRGQQLVDAAAAAAALPVAELGEAVASDDAVSDVFEQVARRAVTVSDEAYVNALGRLVAAALDDARVDEVAYQASRVVQLEPLELRALWHSVRYMGTQYGLRIDVERSVATHIRLGRTSERAVAQRERVAGPLATAALLQLVGGGFVYEDEVIQADDNGMIAPDRDPVMDRWKTTQFGLLIAATTLGLVAD